MTEKQWQFIQALCREHHIPLGGLAKVLRVRALEELSVGRASSLIERLLDEREAEALKELVLQQGMESLFGRAG